VLLYKRRNAGNIIKRWLVIKLGAVFSFAKCERVVLFKRLDLILVVVCLLVTFGIYAEGARMNRAAAKAEFARITEDGLQALDSRMNIYLQSLNGAAGMDAGIREHPSLTISKPSSKSVDIENYLPGINGIGFHRTCREGGRSGLCSPDAGQRVAGV